ncbi:MAG: acyl-CoA dehydrogenase family protein, partial [Candidatus Thorarchaeota archaeon]
KYAVERCLRDVRLLRIGGGTDEIMKYIIQKGIYKKSQQELKEMPKKGFFVSD